MSGRRGTTLKKKCKSEIMQEKQERGLEVPVAVFRFCPCFCQVAAAEYTLEAPLKALAVLEGFVGPAQAARLGLDFSGLFPDPASSASDDEAAAAQEGGPESAGPEAGKQGTPSPGGGAGTADGFWHHTG